MEAGWSSSRESPNHSHLHHSANCGLQKVGQYIEYAKDDVFEFDNLVRCAINFDGTWDINEASFGKYTRQKLEDVWTGKFVSTRIRRELIASDDEKRAEFASILSEHILITECWDADESSKWTIKTA
jgi:hypothetical protein